MPPRVSEPWNAYPAVVVASGVAAGILMASHGGVDVRAWMAGAAVLLSALTVLAARLALLFEMRGPLLTAAALAAALCVGGLRFATFYTVPVDHPLLKEAAAGKNVEWTGWILEAPQAASGTLRFAVRLSGEGPQAGVMASGRSPPGPALRRCEKVVLRGRLDALPRPRNPGDFDYGRYLARRRIYARLHLTDDGILRTGDMHGGPICRSEPVRAAVRTRLARYVPNAPSRAVLEALLLGDGRSIDDDIRDQFARMGLLHLLAVSGLHVMVVGMILYRLLGPALARIELSWQTAEGIRASATTSLLLGYMLLTGCSASVVRAVVMAVLFLGSTALQRPSRSVNTLGAAAAILLLARPAHLFEAGFQLSVTAVGAILVLVPRMADLVPLPAHPAGRHLHTAVSVTAAATVGTLPVVLYHFGQVGLAGLILNLPSIPLTTAALTAGAAAVVLGEAAAHLGLLLGAAADLFAGALLLVAARGDAVLQWTVLRWHLQEPAHFAALILLAAALIFRNAPRIRWGCVALTLLVLGAHLGDRAIEGGYRPQLDILFLDVGQGDATLFRLPNGDGLLVDAGPRSLFADAGARVVVPQLAYHGIRRLVAVVITHPDSDHLGGLPSVLRTVPVDRVIRSGYVHDSALYAETNRLLDSLGIRRETARAGDTLRFPSAVRAYVLHPREAAGAGAAGADAANAHSVALLVRFGALSILLTGDAPARAELDILRTYGDILRVDVLKVGHHGSATSSTAAFLAGAARADGVAGTAVGGSPHAVVSAARENRFGLPSEQVLARLERAGFSVLQTSREGALWYRSDGRRLQRIAWRTR